MVAALMQFQADFRQDPSSIFTWIGAGMRHARTDISLDELMTLAFTGANLNARHVTNIVIPGGLGMVGTTSIVNLDHDRARHRLAGPPERRPDRQEEPAPIAERGTRDGRGDGRDRRDGRDRNVAATRSPLNLRTLGHPRVRRLPNAERSARFAT